MSVFAWLYKRIYIQTHARRRLFCVCAAVPLGVWPLNDEPPGSTSWQTGTPRPFREEGEHASECLKSASTGFTTPHSGDPLTSLSSVRGHAAALPWKGAGGPCAPLTPGSSAWHVHDTEGRRSRRRRGFRLDRRDRRYTASNTDSNTASNDLTC